MFALPGIVVAIFLFDPKEGLVALVAGVIIGAIVTKLYVPTLLAEWNRTGIPGLPKTPEQQRLWEGEREKRGLRKNLVPIVGVLVAALLRTYLPLDLWLLIIPVSLGGLTAYFGGFAWLLYQKRNEVNL
jgi:hypothetical protein